MDKNNTTPIPAKRITTQPVTCREREKMEFEIEFYKRAYKLSQERIKKLQDANTIRHQKLVDTLLLLIFFAMSSGFLMFMFSVMAHWAEHGW